MRGIQRTDKTGLARFRSVYPGWYQGRTVHIHVKVHVAGNVVHTGQLYFPDSLTDRVFRRKPYSRRGKRTTRNANDFVFAQGGRRSMLAPARRRQRLRRQHHDGRQPLPALKSLAVALRAVREPLPAKTAVTFHFPLRLTLNDAL